MAQHINNKEWERDGQGKSTNTQNKKNTHSTKSYNLMQQENWTNFSHMFYVQPLTPNRTPR
jgi:hypothetical protein